MRFDRVAKARRKTPRPETISLEDFSLGLNTVQPASNLKRGEMHQCLNFTLNRSRGLQTRPGLTRITNSAFPDPASTIIQASIGGDYYVLGCTTQGELYYLDGSDNPASIGALEGEARLLSYHDHAIIMDGSYLKTWDGSNLEMAYDDGNGERGAQVYQLGASTDASVALDDTNSRAGVGFTSQSWDSGYTVPITRVTAYLKAEGSPTGDAVAKIYSQSDGAEVSASDTSVDVSDLPSDYVEKQFDFPKTDSFSPGTDYYAVIEYSGGDSSNKVHVGMESVDSGGNAVSYDGSSWSTDSTKKPRMSAQPGKPPKAKFGEVYGTRLFIVDSDKPGQVQFSNVNTFLDWSTSNGGGWIGIVDDSANNFPVGALVNQYGKFYILGRDEQAYLCVLSGAAPSEFSVDRLMDQVAANPDTALSTGNNVFFSDSWGARSMTGVQEFGNIRVMDASMSVEDRFRDYWGDSAFAGYEVKGGRYLLQMPGYPKTLVAHTTIPAKREGALVYPWAEWMFIQHDLTDSDSYRWNPSGSGTNEYYVTDPDGNNPGLSKPPYVFVNDRRIYEGSAGSLANLEWDYADNDGLGFSTVYVRRDPGDPDELDEQITVPLIPYAFGNWGGESYISGHNGHIYRIDLTTTRDDGNDPRYILSTPYIVPDFYKLSLERMSIQTFSRVGGSFDVAVFADMDQVTESFKATLTLPVASDVTIEELSDVTVGESDFPISPTAAVVPTWFNLICHQFLVTLQNMETKGRPIYIANLTFMARRMQ